MPQVLLTRRAQSLRAFPGVWVPPGGYVDPGESLDQAAKRELMEETGIDASNVQVQVSEPSKRFHLVQHCNGSSGRAAGDLGERVPRHAGAGPPEAPLSGSSVHSSSPHNKTPAIPSQVVYFLLRHAQSAAALSPAIRLSKEEADLALWADQRLCRAIVAGEAEAEVSL